MIRQACELQWTKTCWGISSKKFGSKQSMKAVLVIIKAVPTLDFMLIVNSIGVGKKS